MVINTATALSVENRCWGHKIKVNILSGRDGKKNQNTAVCVCVFHVAARTSKWLASRAQAVREQRDRSMQSVRELAWDSDALDSKASWRLSWPCTVVRELLTLEKIPDPCQGSTLPVGDKAILQYFRNLSHLHCLHEIMLTYSLLYHDKYLGSLI